MPRCRLGAGDAGWGSRGFDYHASGGEVKRVAYCVFRLEGLKGLQSIPTRPLVGVEVTRL